MHGHSKPLLQCYPSLRTKVFFLITSAKAALQEDLLFERFIGQTTKCKTSTRYSPRV